MSGLLVIIGTRAELTQTLQDNADKLTGAGLRGCWFGRTAGARRRRPEKGGTADQHDSLQMPFIPFASILKSASG